MTFAVRPIGLVKTGFVFRQTISADTSNYVLRAAAIAAGWDGVVPLDAEVTVSSGIVLSANSTSQYGFDTGSGFPVGTTLKLIMPGYVCGMGGAGGAYSTGATGKNGGPALRAQHAISIDASGGVISGGGGGGGGSSGSSAGGGGGRSGRTNSSGGADTYPGESGTFSSGGKGGAYSGGAAGGTTGPGANGGSGGGGSGGGGGGWGASGGTGYTTTAGGAGGAAVVGNSYITWIDTGTRYGAIT